MDVGAYQTLLLLCQDLVTRERKRAIEYDRKKLFFSRNAISSTPALPRTKSTNCRRRCPDRRRPGRGPAAGTNIKTQRCASGASI